MSTRQITSLRVAAENHPGKYIFITKLMVYADVGSLKQRNITRLHASVEVDIYEDVPAIADQLLTGGVTEMTGGMQ